MRFAAMNVMAVLVYVRNGIVFICFLDGREIFTGRGGVFHAKVEDLIDNRAP